MTYLHGVQIVGLLTHDARNEDVSPDTIFQALFDDGDIRVDALQT